MKNRIVKLLDILNERVYGKEEVMALALLSAVAGESIFLLGPPGVAKSMVARRLKLMFRGGTASSTSCRGSVPPTKYSVPYPLPG